MDSRLLWTTSRNSSPRPSRRASYQRQASSTSAAAAGRRTGGFTAVLEAASPPRPRARRGAAPSPDLGREHPTGVPARPADPAPPARRPASHSGCTEPLQQVETLVPAQRLDPDRRLVHTASLPGAPPRAPPSAGWPRGVGRELHLHLLQWNTRTRRALFPRPPHQFDKARMGRDEIVLALLIGEKAQHRHRPTSPREQHRTSSGLPGVVRERCRRFGQLHSGHDRSISTPATNTRSRTLTPIARIVTTLSGGSATS